MLYLAFVLTIGASPEVPAPEDLFFQIRKQFSSSPSLKKYYTDKLLKIDAMPAGMEKEFQLAELSERIGRFLGHRSAQQEKRDNYLNDVALARTKNKARIAQREELRNQRAMAWYRLRIEHERARRGLRPLYPRTPYESPGSRSSSKG